MSSAGSATLPSALSALAQLLYPAEMPPVAPLPALPPRPPPVVTSPAPESTRPVAGQSAVMGVPVRADSNASTGAEDATQEQRRGGRHTKVQIAPEPQRPTDQPKRSRRSWFGLGQTEKEVAALQGRLGGMSETEGRQVDSAARYLQLRCRRVVKRPDSCRPVRPSTAPGDQPLGPGPLHGPETQGPSLAPSPAFARAVGAR